MLNIYICNLGYTLYFKWNTILRLRKPAANTYHLSI